VVHPKRVRILKEGKISSGPIVYWMSRDQRVRDNWALLFAQELALKHKSPLVVVFCLVPEFLGAASRQYDFMVEGLCQVEQELKKFRIPFTLLMGAPRREIPRFVRNSGAGALICDFSPLRINRSWKTAVAEKIQIPFQEVDAHNIVPCWAASSKLEFAARTIRPKIRHLLPEHLEPFPKLKAHPFPWREKTESADWKAALDSLKSKRGTPELSWIRSGERSAFEVLRSFIRQRLKYYESGRNDPAQDVQSNLSPYLHFGQLSAQRVALEVEKHEGDFKSKAAFLEELIIRRELSDNFCFYNSHYDSFAGFPNWAQKTLNEHRSDKRQYLYDLEMFERARTHDLLWNAAQRQMVQSGKMHGYLRMYWAKKILEWTRSPEEALEIAIYLNDKYELDGRDPNGYVGIAWSIGGVHDRPWFKRPVFGAIRYMSQNGCKRSSQDLFQQRWGKQRTE